MEYGIIKDKICVNSVVIDEILTLEDETRAKEMLNQVFGISPDHIVTIPQGFSVGDNYENNEWTQIDRSNVINLSMIDSIKQKISESKYLLETYLNTHPLEYLDGKDYSVLKEKQLLLQNTIQIYEWKKEIGQESLLEWNSIGEEKMEWLYSDLVQLAISISDYVIPFVKYQQLKEIEIKACLSQEQLDQVVIDYDIAIQGE